MSCIVRFAPSPTGYMHIGNARIAVINYLFCMKNSGKFIFRIDDTDSARSKKEYEDSIKEDLKWLGITKQDLFFRQSERLDRYKEVMNNLAEKGVIYKCYESQEELDYKRKIALSRGKAPVYDRYSLSIKEEEKRKMEESGIVPYWRFKLPDETIAWNDIIAGEISYDLKNVSDPVIMKADGTFLYTFSSVVDDLDTDITHIIRGQDHTTNTAVQIAMMREISGSDINIKFAHLSLLVNKDGSQFSKRLGSLNLSDLRNEGIEPMAINSLMATLGSSLDTVVFTSIEELCDYFDISKFSSNSPKFDVDELKILSKKILHKYSYEQILQKCGELRKEVFELARENVSKITDFLIWEKVLSKGYQIENSLSEDDKEFINNALIIFNENVCEFSKENISSWIDLLKTKCKRSGKSLYMPIRHAISGIEHGPNIIDMILTIGKDDFLRRLSDASCK